MQDAHTSHMDFNNLVFIQIKFKLLQVDIFAYIHFQCQWAIMEVKLFYKNVAWKLHGCVLVQKWNVKLTTFTFTLTRTLIKTITKRSP
jgi:hypothetical protein